MAFTDRYIRLSAVLVTHFLLDLRELVHDRARDDLASSSNLPSIAFAKPAGAQKTEGFAISFGLVEDFTDDTFETSRTTGRRESLNVDWENHAAVDETAQTASTSWPLDDLAARARRVEEELDSVAGGQRA